MKAYVTVDLGFGDSGKGSCVDALVRRYNASLVVRYSGGPQCGHNVYDANGAHHCFSQIGSGTFVPKTYTFLSRYMMVNPLLLMIEGEQLAAKGVLDALNRVFIDNRCLVVTPYHRALNRLREIERGPLCKHGSCGAGVGECAADALAHPEMALRIGDFSALRVFAAKLAVQRDRMMKQANALTKLPDTPEVTKQLSTFDFDFTALMAKYQAFYAACGARCIDEYQVSRLLSAQKCAVFEGAQGVLIDETYGFHPYTTWSTMTMRNALLLLEEAEITEKPTTIGILRSYLTRHGAGPFPTEDQTMTRVLKDVNNPRNPWQDNLRCGALDIPLLEYALRVNGKVDCLAVTHVDKVTNPWPVCTHYDRSVLNNGKFSLKSQEAVGRELMLVEPHLETVKKEAFLPWVEQVLMTPIALTSHGPGHKDKRFESVLEAK